MPFAKGAALTVKKYSRTLAVSKPVIPLPGGAFLPNGQYDVIDEQFMSPQLGHAGETPGRLMLKLTARQLALFGGSLPSGEMAGIETDVRSFVGRPGVTLR